MSTGAVAGNAVALRDVRRDHKLVAPESDAVTPWRSAGPRALALEYR
jgi:hypothetical protein